MTEANDNQAKLTSEKTLSFFYTNVTRTEKKSTFNLAKTKRQLEMYSIIFYHNDLLGQLGVVANDHHGHVERRLQRDRRFAGPVHQGQMLY